MLPNLEQKIQLKRWFGIYRLIYNKGLEIIKNKSYQKGTSLLRQLRDRLIKNENYDSQKGNEWVKQLPADTRDYAVRELVQAFNNNLQSGHHFNMTFKSKKRSQSIEIRAQRQFNVTRGAYKFLSEIRLTEELPELKHDIKIQMTTDKSFYMIIPMDVVRNDTQVPHRIISIDPGIRTLMTGYTPDGFIYHLGENDIQRLCRLRHYQSKLQGRLKNMPEKIKIICARL